ncbi:16S rRNA (cytosine(967)-C(5))-methyltransferase [Nodosilinea sp. LEGE 07298]|uniref:16S rRNA (cytosine(967)-C(5))-methyltransferase n=1 Tax=Nodosilinea sp. LEGE 07298 TaxID=2777970 RepID=UPI00187FC431|nr:16S rRNA (cytosine(967)-C(5))-methyltransferase [Nodosilinea sp. LEGE 07298]MBE9109846.1 16S rRNA (cytosine(967)-C(5))-methyltransferase [Nodosilinea sp. LEGE 07298]
MAKPTPPRDSAPSRAASGARQLALNVLLQVQAGAYADVALHRTLTQGNFGESDSPGERSAERAFATELVYGTVRRQRTLDALIDQLGTRSADKQPPVLRLVLHLGLYQLRYLSAVPASAAVNTSVDLAKANGLGRLSGVVNGLLRQYLRQAEAGEDPLRLPDQPEAALGIQHSYPDWLVALWLDQLGLAETDQLCQWFNQVPTIDLRVNRQQATVTAVKAAFDAVDIAVAAIPGLPYGLRLVNHQGALSNLPGYEAGWWSVQDASAQLVGLLLDPQPGDTVLDVCAAPGGKATQMAEIVGPEGTIWACDRAPSRLKKTVANATRLGLSNLHIHAGDSTNLTPFHQQADRVLVDAPCSGLGTLHRHADARWRQTPDNIMVLASLQSDLLSEAARCVKPGGTLVYATCTLHPAENEAIINAFCQAHPTWRIQTPAPGFGHGLAVAPQGWVKVWPHRHQMDGFFMVKLQA